ncbi:type II toxin-antitoxin system antitoxin CcdA [Enterobacter sp.]|uniref:type II toxin-antitoxin system antitoxin CcdA n=1 Tax=Enterobacter sp. TaxID=42895 RepID=UPI00296EA49E|nr:type II toxin-antitoxin system antitoxin CcdA [Enterobacter sp.]
MKRKINLSVEDAAYQRVKAAGINVSALVDNVLKQEARRIEAEQFKAENREGLEEVANFIAQHGSFADENRSW